MPFLTFHLSLLAAPAQPAISCRAPWRSAQRPPQQHLPPLPTPPPPAPGFGRRGGWGVVRGGAQFALRSCSSCCLRVRLQRLALQHQTDRRTDPGPNRSTVQAGTRAPTFTLAQRPRRRRRGRQQRQRPRFQPGGGGCPLPVVSAPLQRAASALCIVISVPDRTGLAQGPGWKGPQIAGQREPAVWHREPGLGICDGKPQPQRNQWPRGTGQSRARAGKRPLPTPRHLCPVTNPWDRSRAGYPELRGEGFGPTFC